MSGSVLPAKKSPLKRGLLSDIGCFGLTPQQRDSSDSFLYIGVE